MAPLIGPHDEKYEEFYANWTQLQEDLMKELNAALDSDMREPELRSLVEKVENHYEKYYEAKGSAAHQNILQVVIPSWKSPLEKAFLWLGGWRPSMAFQLVYALAGQQIEAELAEFLEGVDTPTFASLSSSQLAQINDIQTLAYKQEEQLSHEMAMLQQSFADQPLLTLAQADALVNAERDDASDPATEGHPQQHDDMDNHMQEKLASLEEIEREADSLRRSTLKKVLNVLDTVQKAQYLVAAAKLQMAVRNLGKKLNGVS